jgi:CHAT domain-containing protein/tetratricopeptide (TPR) repeat protein
VAAASQLSQAQQNGREARRPPAPGPGAPESLEHLVQQAQALQARGDLSGATLLWQRIAGLLEQQAGPDDPATATALNNLGELQRQAGRYTEAEALHRRALAIREQALADDDPEIATSLNNLAVVIFEQGRGSGAEPLWRRALAIQERSLGPRHPITANSLNNLAELLRQQGRVAEAESLYQRALAIRRQTLGEEHPSTASSLNDLGALQLQKGQYRAAESLFQRALAIHEKVLGDRSIETAASLSDLGLLYLQQGRHEEARPLLQRALAIHGSLLGEEHLLTIISSNNLAELLREEGRYDAAERLLRRALAIAATRLGPQNPYTAITLSNLAELQRQRGRYADADTLHSRALTIRERILGAGHPDLAFSLSNLAALRLHQGRDAEGEGLLRRALVIRETVLGTQHPDTATSLNNLAALLMRHERYAEADALFRRALAISTTAHGPRHPFTANTMTNLAELHRLQGRGAEAESLLRPALAIREAVLGREHPDTATSLNNLGTLLVLQQRHAEAEALLRRALAINGRLLGFDHPATAMTLMNLALLHLDRRDTASAAALLSRLSRDQANWLRRELPLQPRDLRMDQLDAQPDAAAATFALLAQDPTAAPLALETRLNRQGLLAEIERRQRLLAASTASNRELVERIAALDRQLASVILSPTQRDDLRRQRRQLEGDLNRQLPALQIAPVSTEQVAGALKSLAPEGLLVEFQRYHPLSRSTAGRLAWEQPRYVALLLHPDGRIDAVPLGEAAAIDRAVERALAASAANYADAGSLWGEVSSLVLSPLRPHLRGGVELFLSPDAALHRVPFAALPVSGNADGQLLSEFVRLRLLTTGRDLVQLQRPARRGGDPVLIADPAYDLPPRAPVPRASASSATPLADGDRSLPASVPVSPGPSRRQQRSGQPTLTNRWTPLPGTAEEARKLAPLLGVSRPFTDQAATAPLVLQLRGPRILHIATHGFFRAEESVAPTAPLATPARLLTEGGDPLLRSGLVMAGANRPEADPGDDGYLTAAEMTGMELEGTELVTLSACESGLGSLRDGEGVYGLQRAMVVAGARATLLSLWKVDDAATATFMQAYYSRLLRGESRADALTRTQAEFRSHPNPLFRDLHVWGAFQLTGEWRPLAWMR